MTQKTSFALAAAAVVLSLIALLRPAIVPPAVAAAEPDPWKRERNYPPLVFTSKAYLICNISSTHNGRQAITTVAGQGFTCDAPMRPISGGEVRLKGQGMHYAFNSFPVAGVPARFTGLGKGTITAMKTEVAVDVTRFRQPGGPGTEIHFNASQINQNGAYVEFTGLFVRTGDSKRFPFRVLFGSAPDGGGAVTPAGPGQVTALAAKSVHLGSPVRPATVTTALYEAEDDVPVLQ